jgi:ketosteroid isomerase-like protein
VRKTGILLAILVFAASGCAPKVDVEAEKAALRNLHDQTAAASNAGDLTSLYSDDAIVMPPNEPALVGKEAIRTWVQGLSDGGAV